MGAPLQVKGLDGDQHTVPAERVETIDASLDGEVLLPGDDGFTDATRLWNAMITRQPAMAIRATSTSDVVRAVAFARDDGLELSVRGGGHNIAGLALSDGGVTLDLSALNSVAVDPDAQLARVAPGCTLGDIDRATQEHGLATTLGFVSETGAAGLTLGGGFGYLTRRFGWTVDDLEEVEIVTADGQVRRASRTEHEDLFWALRGGGGNFGVVTEFVYRLHDVGPTVQAGLIAWPASEAEAVLGLYRDITDSAPRELTLAVLMRNAPPAPWLPEHAHGTPIIVVVACHTGDPDRAQDDLAPLRSHGEPLADLIQEKGYADQQSMLDATAPKGMHYYWKSEFVPGLTGELLDAFRTGCEGTSAPANQAVLFHIAGALNEHDDGDGAVGNRDAAHACVIQSMWSPDAPADTAAANRTWVRDLWETLRPFSTGGNYINFQTADEGDDRTQESYGANHERLRAVKAVYDPANLFRVNRNIRPA